MQEICDSLTAIGLDKVRIASEDSFSVIVAIVGGRQASTADRSTDALPKSSGFNETINAREQCNGGLKFNGRQGDIRNV